MKKNAILALSLVVALTMLVIPVSAANKIEFRANGKLVTYPNPTPEPGAEVVSGQWSVKIMNGKVDFKAFYRERNLGPPEQSPIGTIDEFWITLDTLYEYSINTETGSCHISGEFSVLKKWWIAPDNYMGVSPPPPVYWQDYGGVPFVGDVDIDSNGCVIWFWGQVQGPTLAIQYR